MTYRSVWSAWLNYSNRQRSSREEQRPKLNSKGKHLLLLLQLLLNRHQHQHQYRHRHRRQRPRPRYTQYLLPGMNRSSKLTRVLVRWRMTHRSQHSNRQRNKRSSRSVRLQRLQCQQKALKTGKMMHWHVSYKSAWQYAYMHWRITLYRTAKLNNVAGCSAEESQMCLSSLSSWRVRRGEW